MPAEAKNNKTVLQRFKREIRLATQVSHPHLIAAFDAGIYDNIHYLVLENVEGPRQMTAKSVRASR